MFLDSFLDHEPKDVFLKNFRKFRKRFIDAATDGSSMVATAIFFDKTR